MALQTSVMNHKSRFKIAGLIPKGKQVEDLLFLLLGTLPFLAIFAFLCYADREVIVMKEYWKTYLPKPICEAHPEYGDLYEKAWELAYAHIKDVEGMPQSPYMDEAFCDTQIWIWDTCFMSLFCKYAREIFPGVESLCNFYEVLYGEKCLPYVIPTEKEPQWTGAIPGKAKRMEIHIADNPPLFAWAEYENALFHGDLEYIKTLLYDRRVLQKHYEWIDGLKEKYTPGGVHAETCLIHTAYGYRWEGGRSGMDNTPRGRTGERTNKNRPNPPDMLWIDVIAQQALSAKKISSLFALCSDEENRRLWECRFLEKKNLIETYYWDEADGFYYDINETTHNFCKVMTPASYWVLTAGAAEKERAERMVAHVCDVNTFGGEVPLLSLARNDGNFDPQGRYWRGSLWLPTAYATLKGMAAYCCYDKVHTAAKKILDHMVKTYLSYEPHTIWECYAPVLPMPATTPDGKSYVRPDFCGWSALGPISVYIEYVLGFHTVDAFARTVEWEMPMTFKGRIGIENLRFGDIVTDITAEDGHCTVSSNLPYTLKVCGHAFEIESGVQTFCLVKG